MNGPIARAVIEVGRLSEGRGTVAGPKREAVAASVGPDVCDASGLASGVSDFGCSPTFGTSIGGLPSGVVALGSGFSCPPTVGTSIDGGGSGGGVTIATFS